MKKIISFFIFFSCLFADSSGIMLLKTYNKNYDISGWVYSEKLDGIRAIWDKKQLLSKNNLPILAPESWLKDFPDFRIDGELYTKRNDFENISSIVNSFDKNATKWEEIKLYVFDVPDQKGNLFERLNVLQNWIEKHPKVNIKIIEQKSIDRDIYEILDDYVKSGAEGIVLRDPKAKYIPKRSDKILKLQPNFDSECRVVALTYNEKNEPKSIKCKWFGSDDIGVVIDDGVVFKLSLIGKHKQNPPKVGDIVKFSYKKLSKNYVPMFANIVRKQ